MANDWKHGLFGCFSNCGLCIITFLCPCYTAGKNAEALGDSCCCNALLSLVPILNIILHIQMRGRLRERQGIGGSCLTDSVVSLFCGCCALVQEGQETKFMVVGQSMVRE